MSTQLGKRKLPRRELPWIGTLLDKLPYSKLPTKQVVLRRLMFELEKNHGASSTDIAALTVRDELKSLWEYAGYQDILQADCTIVKSLRVLRDSYRALNKVELSRRNTSTFKKKEEQLLKSLEGLFDISVKRLQSSTLITDEDRDFLQNHWDKTISSTPDLATKKMVEKKLQRQQQHNSFLNQTPPRAPKPAVLPTTSEISPLSDSPSTSGDEYVNTTVKRVRQSQKIDVTPAIFKQLGPGADRLGLSNNELTGMVAMCVNHGGGDLDKLAISKSSVRRARIAARRERSELVKKTFISNKFGQVNFDGKLMKGLMGRRLGKVNRLAVILVQELENKLLAIAKTEESTGSLFVV